MRLRRLRGILKTNGELGYFGWNFYRVVSRSKSMSGGRRYIRVRNRAIANQDFPGENLDFS